MCVETHFVTDSFEHLDLAREERETLWMQSEILCVGVLQWTKG